MAENYCGKSCAECTQKEVMNCPGCKTGPGKEFGGECELARCCRSKGHETCDTCGFRGNCGTLRNRDHMADDRRRKRSRELEKHLAIARRAPILGKWLWVLFWLVIPSTIANIISNENVINLLPGLFWPGEILNLACMVIYGVILLKLGCVEELYHKAGICNLVSCGVSLLITIIAGRGETPTWTLILSIPASIVSWIGIYNEFTAHAEVLWDVDNELSDKWTNLWKWYIGVFLGIFGSILIVLIAPVLGIIVMIAVVIGLIIVDILKLVYLYRAAKCFREYQSAGPDTLMIT